MPSALPGNHQQPIERLRGPELPFRTKCANMKCETGLILQIGQ